MIYGNNDDFIENMKDMFLINHNRISYYNVPCSFDIETSSFYDKNEKRSIMYIWQFAMYDNAVIGRTWSDFYNLIERISNIYRLNACKRIVIYVHNLSYEFQFIRKRFEWIDVFATEERKVLKAVSKSGFEFRCSYRLSGYALATLAKNLTRHEIKKMVGDLDYSLIRTPLTKMSETELGYCVNDVLIVTAYIAECIEDYGDIANIPMTQTGKVRRFVRSKMLNDRNRLLMRKLQLDELEYLQLRKCFQGGFTHANVMYALQECSNVTSYDFTSSYPTVMLSEKFPMSKAKFIYRIDNESFEFYRKNYCCMFDIQLHNVVSKVCFENIISFSKCQKIENYILNNGRVYEASFLQMTITEIDFECVQKFYDFDSYEIRNLFYYEKGYLPKEFIEAILKLYNDKTTLKGVEGKEIEYLVSKEMLNSCYGMAVTNIAHEKIEYINNAWLLGDSDYKSAIDDYNSDRNRFLFYPWGVWVTSYARRNLFTGILECGDDYIYSDTDSIKIFHAENHQEYFNRYNSIIMKKLNAMCDFYNIDKKLIAPKTIKGIEKPLGVWDFDGKYKRFKSLGAKRYLVEYEDDSISLTVSGINKKTCVPWLKEKYHTNDKIFEMFNEMLTVPKEASGKKTLTYIDDEKKGIVKDYQGNFYNYDELSSIHMENSEYCLNICDQYLDFIFSIKKR